MMPAPILPRRRAPRFANRLTAATLMAGLMPMLMVAGCGEGRYPSLAQRPEERAAPAPAAPARPDTTPVYASLAREIEAPLGRARAANIAFRAAARDAARLVEAAQGQPVAGDAWAAANAALAGLDSQRAATAVAQQALERLYVDDRIAHALADADSANGESNGAEARPIGKAIAAARGEVLQMLEAQDAALAALKARLPG